MPPRILVADDDRALQVLLNIILSRAGFEVEFASNGKDALRMAVADSYDAIMMDLIFQDISGMEILDRLSRERPESLRKVVVLTGASSSIVEKLDASRVHAVLRKPFDIQDVIRLTSECVREA
jgi:two-component system response regulator HydG